MATWSITRMDDNKRARDTPNCSFGWRKRSVLPRLQPSAEPQSQKLGTNIAFDANTRRTAQFRDGPETRSVARFNRNTLRQAAFDP